MQTTTIHNTVRPLTGNLRASVVALVLCNSPAHCAEHLVHAWSALEAAARGESAEANRAYARNRLACAKSEPVQLGIKAGKRAAAMVEIAALEAALV